MLPTSRIIHISHNDLDGIAAQFVISRVFYNVSWFNCDYKDIEFTISHAIKQVKMETLAGSPPELFLITDINLTVEIAANLQKQINSLPSPPKLLLLDHHATGADCAKNFDWYHLDVSCCATRLTYQWVKSFVPEELGNYLDRLSALVNVTDLWQAEDARFAKANLIADLMFEKTQMIADMQEHNRNYFFHLIEQCFKRVEEGKSVMQIERDLYQIRLDYLLDAGVTESIVLDEGKTLEGKYHHLILDYITANKLPQVKIEGYRTALFYRWNGTIFQHVSSMYLEKNPHIDIAIRVGTNARLSIRSRNKKIDVGQLSRRYFNGGGHPQAAGGVLDVREIKSVAKAIQLIEQAQK
jgi:hypothetical protein